MNRSQKIAPLVTDLGPETIAESWLTVTPSKLSPASRFKRLNWEFSKSLDESAALTGSAKKMTNLISMSLSAFRRKTVHSHENIKSEKHAKVIRELLCGARRIQVQKVIQRIDELKHKLEERSATMMKVTVCKDPHGAGIRETAAVRPETTLLDLYLKYSVTLSGKIVPFSQCAVICNNKMAPLGDTATKISFFSEHGDVTSIFFAPVAPEVVSDPALRDPEAQIDQSWFIKGGQEATQPEE